MARRKLDHEESFGWLIRNPDKLIFKVREAGAVLSISKQSVLVLLEEGELWGLCHGSIRGTGKRRHQVITRDSILCYLAKTADHDSDMKIDRLCEALDTVQDLQSLRKIYTHLAERLAHF